MGLTPRLVALIAALALIVGGGWVCYSAGKRAERAVWQAAETERMRAIAEAVGETVARNNALAADVDRLRARPERIRVITKEVPLAPDAECPSVSPDLRRLWNAGADSDSSTGAPVVVDGLMPFVAPHGR